MAGVSITKGTQEDGSAELRQTEDATAWRASDQLCPLHGMSRPILPRLPAPPPAPHTTRYQSCCSDKTDFQASSYSLLDSAL